MRTFFVVMALAFVPLVSEATPTGWRVEAGGGAQWVTDRAFDVTSSSDAIGAFAVAVGWTPGLVNERLSFRLGYTASGAAEPLFRSWTSTFARSVFELGARYDFWRASRVGAFVRASGYADVATLSIATGGLDVSDWAFGGGVLAALGTEVVFTRATPESVVGFSAIVEAGWSERFTKARFDALSLSLGDDPRPIAQLPVAVGDIDLSGPLLNVGLVMSF